jgi:hypothetical protein
MGALFLSVFSCECEGETPSRQPAGRRRYKKGPDSFATAGEDTGATRLSHDDDSCL